MTELIVALDGPANTDPTALAERLCAEAEVTYFKIGPQLLFSRGCVGLIEIMVNLQFNAHVMFDFKFYDTVDTVRATVERARDLGAWAVTVHATPRMLEAATAVEGRPKILAVGALTDDPDPEIHRDHLPFIYALGESDGIVCPVEVAAWFRGRGWGTHGADRGKLLVCPGVRLLTGSWAEYLEALDDHVSFAQPAQARAAGADYVVVGRPIYRAPDPVAAARAIMEELKG
jgi:orotidine-5'-phosphate decarboxylase